jgi:hypothetical protein
VRRGQFILITKYPFNFEFNLGKREGIIRGEIMGAYRIWCDKNVVCCQIFSYKYCSMGPGNIMMLTPGGMPIALIIQTYWHALEMNVCFTY